MNDSRGHPIRPGPSPEEQDGFVALENDGRKRTFDYPSNVKLVIRWFVWACVCLALLDGAIYLLDTVFHAFPPDSIFHGLHAFEIEGLPFFHPAYSFVACVLIVLVAKQLRRIVMRDEDFYDS
jgi:hypothetical protein